MMDVRHTTLFKTLIMVGVMGTGLSMTAQNAQAQTPPENVLLAQNDGIAPQNSAEDDIFAAMKALDEVGAMIEEAKRTPAKEAPSIDIHALVTAASTEDAPVVAPKHDLQTAPAVAAKPEVAKPQAVAPKHDVQTAPAVAAKPEVAKPQAVAPKHDVQTAPAVAAKPEVAKPQAVPPKHDVQTAPAVAAKPEVAKAQAVAPKHDVQTAPAVAAKPEVAKAQAVAPKHDVQTAPAIAAKPEVAKAQTVAPKHDVQTAPAVAAKPEVAKPQAVPPKHDVQTAPAVAAKPEVAKAQTVAPKHDVQTAPAVAAKPEVAKPQAVPPKHDVQTAPAVAAKPEVAKAQAVAPKHDVRPDMSQTIPFSLAYILDVYKVNGVDLAAKTSARSTAELYQYAFKQKSVYHTLRPAIGDLAFFHNTADRNRDGRWNDWHSLIGIVESIDDQDTITILVFTSQLERIKLNLKYPELHKSKKGDILNSQLRPNEGSQVGTSAKLFAGFANLLGDVPSVTVIDNWKPGMKF
ncbi:MAG: hypothetical protein ACI4VB_06530 [Bradymonadia bacterium]